MNFKNWFVISALFAVTSVAMGAFAAHALKATLSDYELSIVVTAARYQMYHALAIFLITLVALILFKKAPKRSNLTTVNVLFTIGIILFSGSLYSLALFGTKFIALLTPIGGVCFMAAWLLFIWFCVKTDFKQLTKE